MAVKPNVPEGTLEVSFINVYGSTVSTAQPVTTGGEAFVAKKEFEFRKGDEILVAILYKYYEKELKEFCGMYAYLMYSIELL